MNFYKGGDKVDVGTNIKKYLEERGIRIIFVAKKSGLTPNKLSKSLNGERKLSLEEYEYICGALDVDTNTFLTPKKFSESR